MSAIKKTRPEAFEHGLSSEQLAQLRQWCAKDGFSSAASQMFNAWGIRRSPAAIHRWYHKDDSDLVLSMIASGAAMNRKLDDAYKSNPAPAMERLVDVFKTLVMTLQVQGAADPEQLETANQLFKSALEFLKEQGKAEDRKLEREKFDLLKRKAAQAEQTEKVLTNADLSPEDRARRIQEIYGRA